MRLCGVWGRERKVKTGCGADKCNILEARNKWPSSFVMSFQKYCYKHVFIYRRRAPFCPVFCTDCMWHASSCRDKQYHGEKGSFRFLPCEVEFCFIIFSSGGPGEVHSLSSTFLFATLTTEFIQYLIGMACIPCHVAEPQNLCCPLPVTGHQLKSCHSWNSPIQESTSNKLLELCRNSAS